MIRRNIASGPNGSLDFLLDPGSFLLGVSFRRIDNCLVTQLVVGPLWLSLLLRT